MKKRQSASRQILNKRKRKKRRVAMKLGLQESSLAWLGGMLYNEVVSKGGFPRSICSRPVSPLLLPKPGREAVGWRGA